MEYLHDDAGDILLVAQHDCLGPSLLSVLRTVKELTDRGIGIESFAVELCTSTASGGLMPNMLLAWPKGSGRFEVRARNI